MSSPSCLTDNKPAWFLCMYSQKRRGWGDKKCKQPFAEGKPVQWCHGTQTIASSAPCQTSFEKNGNLMLAYLPVKRPWPIYYDLRHCLTCGDLYNSASITSSIRLSCLNIRWVHLTFPKYPLIRAHSDIVNQAKKKCDCFSEWRTYLLIICMLNEELNSNESH